MWTIVRTRKIRLWSYSHQICNSVTNSNVQCAKLASRKRSIVSRPRKKHSNSLWQCRQSMEVKTERLIWSFTNIQSMVNSSLRTLSSSHNQINRKINSWKIKWRDNQAFCHRKLWSALSTRSSTLEALSKTLELLASSTYPLRKSN